jgi:hypothetical protein
MVSLLQRAGKYSDAPGSREFAYQTSSSLSGCTIVDPNETLTSARGQIRHDADYPFALPAIGVDRFDDDRMVSRDEGYRVEQLALRLQEVDDSSFANFCLRTSSVPI